MATWKLKGWDEYIAKLERLDKQSDAYIEAAVKAGANAGADIVRTYVESIPTDDGYSDHKSGIATIQKKGLLDSFGVTPIRTDKNFTNMKLGFDGYNGLISKRWPKGQPNAMVARAAESGTSFMSKTSFMTKAQRAAAPVAIEEMRRVIDDRIKAIMN